MRNELITICEAEMKLLHILHICINKCHFGWFEAVTLQKYFISSRNENLCKTKSSWL